MQTSPAAPPPPPAVQAPVTGVVAQAPVATTVALPTYAFLRARGAELSRQLTSVQSRRDNASRDLRRGSDESRAGVQARINVMDERIVQIEKDIAENGRQLAMIGGRGAEEAIATTQAQSYPLGLPPGNVTAISVVFTIFVLAPIAMSMARLMWKRGTRIGKAPPANPQADIRLERVEQGVDAIAVEVERISEGQRFVTQLLANNEKLSALSKGTPEPVAVPVQVPVQLNNTIMPGVARRESLG